MEDSSLATLAIPTKAVVIYHDHCVDGFGAAWSFNRLAAKDYSDGVEYIPMQYGQVPGIHNDSHNIDLYILDFSFDRTTTLLLSDFYGSVTVLDHHKTAADVLMGWDHGRKNLEIVFDMGRSGAGITWDYLSDGRCARNELIDYIEDRDIWIWTLEYSKEINALIGFTKKEFAAYDKMSEMLMFHKDSVIDMGALLLESNERHCASIIAATKRDIRINGKQGLVCNCNGQFASDVGNMLAKESGTFGATYYTDTNGDTKFSLRSIGDYDVAEIAKLFGGGGHRNAAGFALKDPEIDGTGVTIWNITTPRYIDDLPDDYEVN